MDYLANCTAGTDDVLYTRHTHRWCGVKYGNWGSVSDQHGFVVEAVGSSLPATHPDLSTGGSFSLLIHWQSGVCIYICIAYLYLCLGNHPLFTVCRVCEPLLWLFDLVIFDWISEDWLTCFLEDWVTVHVSDWLVDWMVGLLLLISDGTAHVTLNPLATTNNTGPKHEFIYSFTL